MDAYLEANRTLWDSWTALHHTSSFYDVDGFRAGASSLNSLELEAVGDVTGQDLLHLQCHFGLDTLSWARQGARVTGVDFSDQAIALAQGLARELGIAADFHRLEVTHLPVAWTDRFDVVFTSYGVLPWLPDLNAWAATIARVLHPGGAFHLVEFHPFATMLDDDAQISHPYFRTATPERYSTAGSYAEPEAPLSGTAFEWSYSLADVFAALSRAGLTIRALREYPYSPYGCFAFLEEVGPRRWKVRGAKVDVPLAFSLRATK